MIITLIILILCFWLWQNIQHEGAHVIAAKYFKAEIIEFWPFPIWKTESWFPMAFAYMKYKPTVPFTESQKAITYIAPQVTNTILLFLLGAILIYLSLPIWLSLVLLALMITNYLDGAYNLATYYKSQENLYDDFLSDGWGFAKFSKVNITLLRSITVIWHLGFLGLLTIAASTVL